MKKVFAAVLILCLLLAGCGAKPAVEEKLISAFMMESSDAMEYLGVTEDTQAQYSWCGRKMDTQLLFSAGFTHPESFTATGTYPANTDNWTFITESAARMGEQFGEPISTIFITFDEQQIHFEYTKETAKDVFMEFWNDETIRQMHFTFDSVSSDWKNAMGRCRIWCDYKKDSADFENVEVTFTLWRMID